MYMALNSVKESLHRILPVRCWLSLYALLLYLPLRSSLPVERIYMEKDMKTVGKSNRPLRWSDHCQRQFLARETCQTEE